MITVVLKQIKIALLLLIIFTFITGLLYPLIVTGLATIFFPWRANGSIIEKNGNAIGSRLIGQYFDSPEYFWGRPSATTPFPYNAASSSGSNMSPSNINYLETVKKRVDFLKKANPNTIRLIPVGLITASGSGLDPDIGLSAAFYQVPRIAKARHISTMVIQSIIVNLLRVRTFEILGEPRLNVLELNLALDDLRSSDGRKTTKS